jgi:hypothetical protein
MNCRVLCLCFIAAMPSLLSAQETKVVNCRTLEAAGNFVGPDEVLDGDKVCQKLKPGAKDPAKPEPPKPLPGAIVSGDEPMSVAEAAAKGKKATTDTGAAEKTAAAPEPAAAPAPAPVPSVAPVTTVSKPAEPETSAPMAVPVAPIPTPVKPEIASPLTKPSQGEQAAAATQRAQEPTDPAAAAAPSASAPSAPSPVSATPPRPIHRDAPVAPGTPSAPPEKDNGFSDANAVERPAPAATESRGARTGSQSSGRALQVGAFDKAPAASQIPNGVPGGIDETQKRQRTECAKNVTVGSLRDEKLVLGAPEWAEQWIAKNQKTTPNLCFAAAPLREAKNYLIVFYILPANQSIAAMPMPESTPTGGAGAFTAKPGSTWRYAAEGKDGVPALTPDEGEPHSEGQVWYATAYTEDGMAVAERWPEQPKRAGNRNEKNPTKEQSAHQGTGNVPEELLSEILEDLKKL